MDNKRRAGRPRTYRERLNVYLDDTLKRRLSEEAKRSDQSEGEIVRRALEAELAKREGNHPIAFHEDDLDPLGPRIF